MAALTGNTIASTYKDLLQVSNSNSGVDGTLRNVEDGEGTASALQISTGGINVAGTITASGTSTFNGTVDINNTSDFGSNAMTNVNIDSGTINGTTITSSADIVIDTANKGLVDEAGNNILERTSGGYITIGDSAWNEVRLNTTGSTDFVLDNSGRVGIGVTSPETPLAFEPSDTTTATEGIKFQNSSSTSDAILQPWKFASGMGLILGSNFYIDTTGNVNRFNSAEESSGILIDPRGTQNFYTGGTGGNASVAMTIDSSQRVGIGTTSPTTKFEVYDDTSGTDFTTVEYDYNTQNRKLRFGLSGGNPSIQGTLTNDSGTSLAINPSGGSVGIGDTSPDSKLTINGGINNVWAYSTTSTDQPGFVAANNADYASQTNILYNKLYGSGVSASAFGVTLGNYAVTATDGSANNGLIVGTFNSTPLIFGTNQNERMRITSDGKVGIGDTSPTTAKLSISHDDSSDANGLLVYNPNTGSGAKINLNLGLERNASAVKHVAARLQAGKEQEWTGVPSTVDGFLAFQTVKDETLGERMRINSAGFTKISNVGTYIDTTGSYHEMYSNIDGTQILSMRHNSGTAFGQFIDFSSTASTVDDNTRWLMKMNTANVTRVYIWSDGDIQNHDNSYGSTSDQRIKQDIRDANSQWDDIKALRIRNFKKNEDVAMYGDNAWEQIGVVAQELEASGMDKLVKEHPASEEEIASNEDINDGDMVKGVKYSVLYMKAVKALQEAMTRIETLESKVEALENA